jgi:hypothetical protein
MYMWGASSETHQIGPGGWGEIKYDHTTYLYLDIAPSIRLGLGLCYPDRKGSNQVLLGNSRKLLDCSKVI